MSIGEQHSLLVFVVQLASEATELGSSLTVDKATSSKERTLQLAVCGLLC